MLLLPMLVPHRLQAFASLSYSWVPRMRQMDMASDAAATHSCEGLVQEKSLLFLAESRSELTLQKASCQGGSVVC